MKGLDDLFAGYLGRYEASRTKFADVDDAVVDLAKTSHKIAILSNGAVEQ